MVIIDTLYQLIERNTANVSILWKVFQIGGYATVAITGIIATVSFYCLLYAFQMNCILYPIDIRFKNITYKDHKYAMLMKTVNLPTNTTLDVSRTEWHGNGLCKYCISMWMLSFISGTILAAFVLLNPRGGSSYHHTLYSQPWKQVIPMFAITVVIIPFISYSTFKTFGGINNFCAAFKNYTGSSSCNKYIDTFSLKYSEQIRPVYTLQHIVKASSALVCASWIFCALLLLIRLYAAPDFELQVIMLTKKMKTCEFQPKMLSRPSKIYSSGRDTPAGITIDAKKPSLITRNLHPSLINLS